MTEESIKKEVSAVIKDIFRSFEEHRPDGIEAHMHPDVTVWDVFTPQLIRGTAEREAFHRADQAQMQARGKLTLKIEDPVVDAWGDSAIARYYLEFDYEPPNPANGRVRITNVCRKVGGRWLIVHHHEGLVPTGIPPIAD
ncbi:MAG: nuclear transport factor 2 family protein [Proteobacteria bacterium]|nr:nuclear transport factor 2 family protein [Pseudomonadota bacterium]MDA1059984.1 nuclear transport factor 2 family protein [Pseudomonadota bacterium]